MFILDHIGVLFCLFDQGLESLDAVVLVIGLVDFVHAAALCTLFKPLRTFFQVFFHHLSFKLLATALPAVLKPKATILEMIQCLRIWISLLTCGWILIRRAPMLLHDAPEPLRCQLTLEHPMHIGVSGLVRAVKWTLFPRLRLF